MMSETTAQKPKRALPKSRIMVAEQTAKVYKDAWYDFGVAKGGMAKDKELKCIVPASKDDSFGRQNSTEIRYSVRLKAEKKDGVFGFRGLPTKNYILVFADK